MKMRLLLLGFIREHLGPLEQSGVTVGSNPPTGAVGNAIALAKASGRSSAVVPPIMKFGMGLAKIAKAAETYSFVLAEPTSAKTIVSTTGEIETWYTLKAFETLKTQLAVSDEADLPIPPSIVQPLRGPVDQE